MKILIDVSTLLSPKSGVGHYTSKIASALLLNNNFDVNFFTFNNFYKDLNFLEKENKDNLFSKLLKKNFKIKHLIETNKLNRFIKKNQIEIFHQPNFITHNLEIKNISTVHDLSWIHFPEFFLKKELKYLDQYFEKSLSYSSRIIVVSHFIKKEICEIFNFPDHLVDVVYQDIRTDLKNLAEVECLNFLNKFNLKFKNFFLIINTLENRKNFDLILEIYKKLDIKIQEKYPLIIFGMKGRASDQILDKIKNVKNCKYLGYLDQDYLNQCLSSAKILFYPSLYEGFGITPLESMAAGTPVVASRINITLEILKDNAFLADLDDESEWINKISLLIEDKKSHDQLVKKGLNYSLNFKKDNTVNDTLEVYKNMKKLI